jgi:hypothetical protein
MNPLYIGIIVVVCCCCCVGSMIAIITYFSTSSTTPAAAGTTPAAGTTGENLPATLGGKSKVKTGVSDAGVDVFRCTNDYGDGPIWSNKEAQGGKCSDMCTRLKPGSTFTGQWVTTIPNKMSVCNCQWKQEGACT